MHLFTNDEKIQRYALFFGMECSVGPIAAMGEGTVSADAVLINASLLGNAAAADQALLRQIAKANCGILLYGLTADTESGAVLNALSEGAFGKVRSVAGDGEVYEICGEKDVAGPFRGLSFGPVQAANDGVLEVADASSGRVPREWIRIGKRPFMASVLRSNGRELICIAGQGIADLEQESGDRLSREMFSQVAPFVMALRQLGGDRCYRPASPGFGCVIVDDPLLQARYGHLNVADLPRFTTQHRFHLTIAFIPHGWRSSARSIVELFRKHSERLSICTHGNDHTGGEFASTDSGFLHYALETATLRMRKHEKRFGLACDRVMVFPQGRFSKMAMAALKQRQFLAAVNTVPYPQEDPVQLTFRDILAPAVLRFSGFPLFLRKPVQAWTRFDVAACLFFGRPVLVVAHHEIGKEMESLAEFAGLVNSVEPCIQWRRLADIVEGSYWTRITSSGVMQVRAFGMTVCVVKPPAAVDLEWAASPLPSTEVSLVNIQTGALRQELPGGTAGSPDMEPQRPGFSWLANAYLRRLLSELRDNYLSRNENLLRLAQGARRQLSK